MSENEGNLGSKRILETKVGTLYEIFDDETNKTIGFATEELKSKKSSIEGGIGVSMAKVEGAIGGKIASEVTGKLKIFLHKDFLKNYLPLNEQIVSALAQSTSSINALKEKIEDRIVQVSPGGAVQVSGTVYMVATQNDTYLSSFTKTKNVRFALDGWDN